MVSKIRHGAHNTAKRNERCRGRGNHVMLCNVLCSEINLEGRFGRGYGTYLSHLQVKKFWQMAGMKKIKSQLMAHDNEQGRLMYLY
jgi:hypothetical protein